MEKKTIEIQIAEYDYNELLQSDLHLIENAKEAALKAYSPYSHFSVGAAVMLENGVIIQGNNQENAAYPSGLCAERVAIFYANATYPKIAVTSIAVTVYYNGKFSEHTVPPCGSCRQVLLETELRFKVPIRMLMAGDRKVKIIDNVKSLLPLHFEEDFLK